MSIDDLKQRQAAITNAVLALEGYPWLSTEGRNDTVEQVIGILLREISSIAHDIDDLQYADK